MCYSVCLVAGALPPISGSIGRVLSTPGTLGDAHSLVIGQKAVPNQFAHPSRPVAITPSLPVTGWLGWLDVDTGQQV